MKTAIEVEYWVVDEDGALTDPGSLTDSAPYVDPEFVEPMLEIKTSPCETMGDLRAELTDRLRRVVRAAAREDVRLVPLGTPIATSRGGIALRESDRTDLQRRLIGPTFDDARVCAGTHVHFEQTSVADQLNVLTALDPAFALANTSSFYRGERLVECARPYLYRKSCYARHPEQGQLWSYVEDAAEWEARLESAYGDLRDRARQRGIDDEAFEATFDAFDAVWTPVKLRKKFPTVEWRSPDAARPSRVLELTADVRSIVEDAVDRGTTVAEPGEPVDGIRLPPFETVERVVDRAMNRGAADPTVTDYLRGFGIETDGYDDPASRVRADRVSRRRARTIRLAAADRLEADLGLATPSIRSTVAGRSLR